MSTSLIAVLKNAPEFRGSRGQRHELWFVLLVMILAALCGYWGYRPAAEFAKRYGAEVCQLLGLLVPEAMPSHSTFRRVMLGLNLVAFAELCNRWAAEYVAIEPGEWVAVDGKSIRGRLTRYNLAKQNFIALVSVFSQKRKVVLHAQPMENKYDSEAHLVQAELAVLDLKGAVVTLDALHTKKTVDAIKQQDAHYLLCVKGNHKKLHQALIAVSRQHKPIDAYQHSEHSEHSHGRWEHRRLLVYDQLEGCAKPWTDLQRLICVHGGACGR